MFYQNLHNQCHVTLIDVHLAVRIISCRHKNIAEHMSVNVIILNNVAYYYYANQILLDLMYFTVMSFQIKILDSDI